MQWLMDVLKSRGKAGAVALIVIGGYGLVEHFLGNAANPTALPDAMGWVMAGLSLFGIRMKQG